jgi:hypothetical protein
MPDQVSKEEMSARLEAVEARIDAKLEGIRANNEIMTSAISGVSSTISALRQDIKEDRILSAQDAKEMKRTVVGAALGTVVAVVAVVVGMASFL